MTIASDLLWDDLLDCVEADTVTDALLIGLLPRPMPRPRRRRLATLVGHVHNGGVEARPAAPPPPATMAEQLCVGALTHHAKTAVVDLARDGAVALDLTHEDDGVDLTLWNDLYLADVDHELLYDQAFRLIADGLSNSEIAKELYISDTKVKTHITHTFRSSASATARRQSLASQGGLFPNGEPGSSTGDGSPRTQVRNE